MAYSIFSDSACNLPGKFLRELDIQVVPFPYMIDGQSVKSSVSPDDFDGHAFYEKMRSHAQLKTSLINADTFATAFRPFLQEGNDILYVGLSSGVSGTMQSADIAKALLEEEFPQRKIVLVDSKGAGLGEGLLACRAADFRRQGLSLEAALPMLEEERDNLCEFFTVDDLMYLRHTGRVSGVTALMGTALNIKPLLRGDEEGHIVMCGKCRGRKKAIDELASLYAKRAVSPETQRVFISHGDCLAEAETLARKIRQIAEPKELTICIHEPMTGSHVGPGMLALFFIGDSRKP